ncbi:hypothetical protein [Sphingomonas trueperi]|uniref:Uncharacterized protein n=1 Tax=Sphingomonas trueperi TaxID=53317 RepID=A0A7X6BEZ7_9SPHN|nr:hypothetical protein [Sphingomonas trueperi]NJB99855.1 hypothetical protein [Sphingomonas trueperi]
MIAPLIALAARWGVVERLRRPVAWLMALGLAIVLLGLFWGGWRAFDWFNDRQAVQRDRTAAQAEMGQRQIRAERSAGAARDARDAAARQQQQELKEKGDAALRDGRSPWDAVANEL